MSALYVLVLALVWAGIGVAAYRLWSAYLVPERGISRPVRQLGGALLVIGWLFVPWYLVAGRKALLDAEVRELCAKDGGIKVYETVKAPKGLTDKGGVIRIPDKAQAKPSDEYYYEVDIRYYKRGNPEMSRRQYRIVRRGDGKVLGELVFYGRGGGDLPGPWHGSSFTCPDPAKLPNFESSVFMKGE